MRSWIAGVTVAVAMAAPPTAAAQGCDPQALLAGCGHAVPADASFLDLASRPAAPALVPASQSAPTDAVPQPAVYTAAAPVLDPAAVASLAPGPAPDFAWLLALGFLGLIVLRRTRAARAF